MPKTIRLQHFLAASVVAHAALVGSWLEEALAPHAQTSSLQVVVHASIATTASTGEIRKTSPQPKEVDPKPIAESLPQTEKLVPPANVGGKLRSTPPVPEYKEPHRNVRPEAKTTAHVKPKKPTPSTEIARSESTPSAQKQETPYSPSPILSPVASQWRTEIQAALMTSMQQHFRYPLVARKRGWQGIVRLRFTVDGEGKIEKVEVTESSGYAVLDRSALSSARRIAELPVRVFDHSIPLTPIDIPVRYQLQG